MNRNKAANTLLAASLLTLVACSNGGSVSLGGGQNVDPGTVDFPVAYVKHYFDEEILEDLDELNNPGRTRLAVPDADVFLRTSASPSGEEVDITGAMTTDGNYDMKDLDVSPDGTKLVFSMRGPIGANDDEIDPPYWTMWEYDLNARTLQRVIDPTLFPAGAHDVSPHYLPDGSIVFSSTRQRGLRAVLLDEGKPGYEAQFQTAGESAFLLHVLSADRQSIEQITYTLGHDLWPETLSDAAPFPANPRVADCITPEPGEITPNCIPQQGRIVFSRWDNSGNGMSLYTANADGSGLQLLYGARSHEAGLDGNEVQFTRPREMEDGRILTLVRPFDEDTDLGGDLLVIDASRYVENSQPLAPNATLDGPAQRRITANRVRTIEGPSPGGRFHSAFPLWDGTGRVLVSWSLCRVQDSTLAVPVPQPCTDNRLDNPDFVPAPPLYSGFLFNPGNNTLRPLFPPAEGVMISDLVAMQARTTTWVKAASTARPLLADQGVGVLNIRSVYDFDGTPAHLTTTTPSAGCPNAGRSIIALADPMVCLPADRPARFIRIEEAVPRFDRDLDDSLPDIDFGAAVGSGVGFMRTILGYAPIEPDGSVSVRVPANVPFTFSILDADGRRLPQFGRHGGSANGLAWLQLRPGEERHCNGCHEANVERSHGRDRTSASAWSGAVAGVSNSPFSGTTTPIAVTTRNGDTMALARARATCVSGGTACSEIPRMNLLDLEFWNTAPTVDPAVLVDLRYGGSNGLATPAPTSTGCQSNWTGTCRIVVNYEQHIQPLWQRLRQVTMDDGMGGTTIVSDDTCTNCHAPVDTLGAPQVPAGQLDLTDGDRDPVSQHKNAYTELVTGGNQQTTDANGQVIFVTVLVPSGEVDPVTGEPILIPQQVPEGRRVTPLSARGSTRFITRFANGGGTVNHSTFLTPGEMRLISEWIDLGAQYYNNQFDPGVPLDD